MIFEEHDRVFYTANPLAEVVCQFTFPRNYMIETTLPADFQAAIGKGYSSVETRQQLQLNFESNEISSKQTGSKYVYDFSTGNSEHTISLSSDYIAVRTTNYVNWEGFFSHVQLAINAFMKSYDVPHFKRVGLRYINVIDREKLGLADESWASLVRGSILGILADENIPQEDILGNSCSTLFQLEFGRCAMNTGLNIPDGGRNPRFVIDTDFFTDEPISELNHAFDILKKFNSSARDAFRWSICDNLHKALSPQPPK